jgi:hypothetical protein
VPILNFVCGTNTLQASPAVTDDTFRVVWCQAAMAYDKAAKNIFGNDKAFLNFDSEGQATNIRSKLEKHRQAVSGPPALDKTRRPSIGGPRSDCYQHHHHRHHHQ